MHLMAATHCVDPNIGARSIGRPRSPNYYQVMGVPTFVTFSLAVAHDGTRWSDRHDCPLVAGAGHEDPTLPLVATSRLTDAIEQQVVGA